MLVPAQASCAYQPDVPSPFSKNPKTPTMSNPSNSMSDQLQQSFPRLSSPDPTGSETNTSVQVQLDSWSNRDPAATASQAASRRPSPARSFDPLSSLGRQAVTPSQSSHLSLPDPALQPTRDSSIPQEDFLMGLVSGGDSLTHGQKRPREAESDDEPSPKRDRLEEELEALAANHPMAVSASGLRVASVIPVSAAPGASPISPQDIDALHMDDLSLETTQTVNLGTRRTLAARPATRRLPGVKYSSVSKSARHSSPSDDDEDGGTQGK
ncbi:hypothetical protein QBC43DRAFT_324075 [Cladorrhinum sp. PSN259]|nr:hypothetical protein QBC43DRAFT_324075 [Cladorrhinum sp. PSN259]